ncbi:MAG: hypothetical protein V3S46_06820 [Nitrospinota bacterium]
MANCVMRFLPKSGIRADFDLLALCTLAFLYSLLIFSHGIYGYGILDWDATFMVTEVFRRSIVLFGEPPLWNPYGCGGMPIIFHPQYPISPLWVGPPLLLGTVVGVKISIVLHFIIGAAGMVFLSRKLEFSRAGVWAATSIFVFSPFHSWHLFAGIGIFIGIMLLPWLVYFLLDSGHSYKSAYMAGVVVFLLITGLAPTMVIPIFMFIAIWFVFESFARRSPKLILGVTGAVAMGTLFSLFKVLYTLEFFQRQGGRNTDYLIPALSFDILPHALFVPEKALVLSSHLTELPPGFLDITDMWELSVYIGIPAGIMVIIGIATGFRKIWPLLLSMSVSLWVAAGYNADFSLFEFLHRLPIFDSMRYASRFRVGFFFGLALLAGMGMTVLSRKVKGTFMGLLAALILIDLLMASAPLMYRTLHMPMDIIKIEQTPGPFRQVWMLPIFHQPLKYTDYNTYPTGYRNEYLHIMKNIGIAKCYDPTPGRRATKGAGEPGYAGEIFSDSPSKIEGIDWTPRSAVVKIEREKEGLLFLNQNWDPGWNAEINGQSAEVVKAQGLVAVQTPAGKSTVRFYYLPREWLSTLALSFVSIVLLGWLAFRRGRD